jgi:hypothetical protein
MGTPLTVNNSSSGNFTASLGLGHWGRDNKPSHNPETNPIHHQPVAALVHLESSGFLVGVVLVLAVPVVCQARKLSIPNAVAVG